MPSRVRKNSQGRNKFGKGLPSSQGWDPDLVGEREIAVHLWWSFVSCHSPGLASSEPGKPYEDLAKPMGRWVPLSLPHTVGKQAACSLGNSGKHLPDSDATAGDRPHTTDGKPQEQEGPGGMKKERAFLCYTLQYPSCTLPTKHNIAPDGKREMCLQSPD